MPEGGILGAPESERAPQRTLAVSLARQRVGVSKRGWVPGEARKPERICAARAQGLMRQALASIQGLSPLATDRLTKRAPYAGTVLILASLDPQGFMAATSMTWVGNTGEPLARAMVTYASSSGSRDAWTGAPLGAGWVRTILTWTASRV